MKRMSQSILLRCKMSTTTDGQWFKPYMVNNVVLLALFLM
jgi:hypothetical protein